MALYSYTRDELTERTLRIVRDWKEGTATGGSTTTVVDTNRLEADDYWQSRGAFVYLRTGTYAGSWKEITDSVHETKTLVFAPALAGAVVAGNTYALLCEWTWADVVEMINTAIDMVAEEALLWKVDETSITTVASTYEYELPTDFMFINKVTMADSNGTFEDMDEIPPDHYRIIPSTIPKLRFLQMPTVMQHEGHTHGSLWRNVNFTASRKLRVEGLGSQGTLTSDTSVCNINPAFVCFQAAALLHGTRIRSAENDPDYHRIQQDIWQKEANRERLRVASVQLPPNSKRVRE